MDRCFAFVSHQLPQTLEVCSHLSGERNSRPCLLRKELSHRLPVCCGGYRPGSLTCKAPPIWRAGNYFIATENLHHLRQMGLTTLCVQQDVFAAKTHRQSRQPGKISSVSVLSLSALLSNHLSDPTGRTKNKFVWFPLLKEKKTLSLVKYNKNVRSIWKMITVAKFLRNNFILSTQTVSGNLIKKTCF